MSRSFQFDQPDRVTVGTVGAPGARVFYLQARQGREVISVKLEKAQVAQLAAFLAQLLADLPPVTDAPTDLDLESPVHQEWVVSRLRVAPYDEATDRIHLLAEELVAVDDPAGVPSDDDDDAGFVPGESLQLALSRAQVRALIDRAEVLLAGGRPACELCGNPMDPAGHSCPKTNGHTRIR